MNTRIIIEKDGERYACDAFDVDIIKDDSGYLCQLNGALPLTELPPVIRTDNSEVIARLEAENAKLKAELEDKYSEMLKVIEARNELAELNRECCDENEKLREALNPIMTCNNRLPAWHIYYAEAVHKAQEIMKSVND